MFQPLCKWEGKTRRNFLVVGYYSINTPYEKEKEVLALSLQSLDYSYCFYGFQSQGTWQKNTQLKAQFMDHVLNTTPGPVLYLDVDAIMVQPPVLLDTISADIAAVHFADTRELLSGTVYFANTPVCRQVVKRWIEINVQYPVTLPNGVAAWDQRTLEMAIKEIRSCKFVELPQEYTWITELTQRRMPGLAPVIMHTRGAYRFKRIINRKNKEPQEGAWIP